MEPMPGSFIEEQEEVPDKNIKWYQKVFNKELLYYITLKAPLLIVYGVFSTCIEIFHKCIKISSIYRYKNVSHENNLRKFILDSKIPDQDEHEYLTPYLCGSYVESLNKANEQGKFVFIFLQSTLLDNSSQVTNNVLKELAPLLKKYQGVFWMGDISSNTEALQVADMFKVKYCPALIFLCLDNNGKFKLQFKVEGSTLSANVRWKERLESKIMECYSQLLSVRQQRNVVNEQNRRYDESLRRDQELERQQQEAMLKGKWLRWRNSELKAEPRSGCKIRLTFPDGERIIRKFDPSCPVEEIYAFVELHRLNITETSRERVDYHYDYPFILATPVPRAELRDINQRISENSSICPSGNLIVEMNS
ncbi:uncharacterized protein SCODWIG_03271 [Saccharomycodes ludwigii]|uniref:UBX domain-containing protein n=1 Tax=Saccharomycodes ludwigii TaxID=36035 RepID=A0A376BBJ4_9ASCO|nr:hypothetical protein SCDLUD_001335 [Saccharomycodes ludwigii]KAH3901572.1 hypothetical protein SCDLUD_001335 [Saccharomycodes ludwigii]SSD61510.1 uncharacterized protein SCODWIG_03271 [Saccharomycodes ludwigii]